MLTLAFSPFLGDDDLGNIESRLILLWAYPTQNPKRLTVDGKTFSAIIYSFMQIGSLSKKLPAHAQALARHPPHVFL
jgi:hypothetical protein